MPTEALTVRDLRRLWKPHKERLNGHAAEHPTTIRFHRACSWLSFSRLKPATHRQVEPAGVGCWNVRSIRYDSQVTAASGGTVS